MNPQMSERRRDLMLKVVDGNPQVALVMYQYYVLEHYGTLRNLDGILTWLIESRLTGKQFLAWLWNVHGNSFVNSANQALEHIERRRQRPVILLP